MTIMSVDPRLCSDLSEAAFDRMVKAYPPRVGEGGLLYSGAVRLSWPCLDKPRANPKRPDAKPKYELTGLFPHRNIGVFMGAIEAEVRRLYPNVRDPKAMMDVKAKGSAVKDQGMKVSTEDGGYNAIGATMDGYVPGLMFFIARSGLRVPMFHVVGGRRVSVLPEEVVDVMYAGCWVDVELKMLKSGDAGNPGIFLGLQQVSKIVDDRRFGGGSAHANSEAFGGVVEIEAPASVSSIGSSSDWD